MDALADPECEEVAMMSSAQVGKTEIINNAIGYFIDQDPCPILHLQPTIEMGESWSKDRLAPMIRDTPALRSKLLDPTSRASGNTLRHKTFPGGHITIAGANSPASLASRPIRFFAADEIDRYPLSAGTEGDPVKLGWKRTTTFWNRKGLYTSTPTIKGISRIEALYLDSSQERYHVPCPGCGHLQVLRWAGVKWERRSPGHPILESVAYECEACQERWLDVERWAAIANNMARWVAQSENKKRRGFHLNEIYSSWVELAEMVEGFYEAKKSPDTHKVWVNTSLGETWEDESAGVKAEHLYGNRSVFGPDVPEKAVLLTAGVDVQDNRLELETVAWAPNMESWSMRFETIEGDPRHAKTWSQLDEVLQREWTHGSGVIMRVEAVCIDSGFLADEVYAFCQPRSARRIFATKGRGGAGIPFLAGVTNKNKYRCRVHSLGVDGAKSRLFGYLSLPEYGACYCHFPADRHEDYFTGLVSERPVTRYVKGQPSLAWQLRRGIERNEPLDCRILAMAAVELMNPHWPSLKRAFEISTARSQGLPEPKPIKRTRRRVRSIGY